jgi:hypothetical protein
MNGELIGNNACWIERASCASRFIYSRSLRSS